MEHTGEYVVFAVTRKAHLSHMMKLETLSARAYPKHLFTGKVGWGSHPPHSNFRLKISLFQLNKPNLGCCEWGVEN
jgi:hypothetical protein